MCDDNHPIILEEIDFPDQVIGIAVEHKTQNDLDKLSNGLAKLAEEDPTFTVKTDEETGQTVISGMGELHLEIIIDRLTREFRWNQKGESPGILQGSVSPAVKCAECNNENRVDGVICRMIVRVEPAGFDLKRFAFRTR